MLFAVSGFWVLAVSGSFDSAVWGLGSLVWVGVVLFGWFDDDGGAVVPFSLVGWRQGSFVVDAAFRAWAGVGLFWWVGLGLRFGWRFLWLLCCFVLWM